METLHGPIRSLYFSKSGQAEISDTLYDLNCRATDIVSTCACCSSFYISHYVPDNNGERFRVAFADGSCFASPPIFAYGGAGIVTGSQTHQQYSIELEAECDRMTAIQAELLAIEQAMLALIYMHKACARCVLGKRWVVATDSDQAAAAITRNPYIWRQHGWYHLSGRPVADRALIERIVGLRRAIEMRHGVKLAIWPISRWDNELADRLAKQAFTARRDRELHDDLGGVAHPELAQNIVTQNPDGGKPGLTWRRGT